MSRRTYRPIAWKAPSSSSSSRTATPGWRRCCRRCGCCGSACGSSSPSTSAPRVCSSGCWRRAGATDVSNALLLIIQIVFGFEAGALYSASLERRGWRLVGTVSGRNAEDAERRFLEAWLPTRTEIPQTVSTGVPSGPRETWAEAALAQAKDALARGRRVLVEGRDRNAARRHHQLRLRQPALGRQGVRARRPRKRSQRADHADGRPRHRLRRRPHRAAGRRRLCRLQARPRSRAGHARSPGRHGAHQGPAVSRHLRRHAAHGQPRPRVRDDRRARLDRRRGARHCAERTRP